MDLIRYRGEADFRDTIREMIWSTNAKDGLPIHLISLSVVGTYGGLLEGRPNDSLNDELVTRAISSAQSRFPSWKVHLVPPTIRNLKKHRELPKFECTGLFRSFATKDHDMHASGCVLVWFQEKTIVEGIELSLVDLDWWSVAEDFEF